MKNIMKMALVLIASLSLVSSANAGEVSVTGNAEATYMISSSDSATGQSEQGKSIGISNEIAFTGTGELDNGWSWKWQTEMDPDAAGATQSDDTRLEITTGYGMIGFYNTEGDLNTQLKSSAAAYAPGHDFGTTGGGVQGTGINSYNNLQYHTPGGLLPYGIVVKAAYSPSADAIEANDAANAGTSTLNLDSVESFQVTASPIDGLSVGASYLEKNGSGAAALTKPDYETGGLFAKYAAGPFTVGAGRHWVEPGTNTGATGTLAKTAEAVSTLGVVNANVKYFENTAMSVAFNVNDDLSISYDKMVSTAEARTIVANTAADTDTSRDLTISSIQLAYSMGGMTLSLGQKDVDGIRYIKDKASKETLVSVKMAF
jgi:outer membrane protein OmpU